MGQGSGRVVLGAGQHDLLVKHDIHQLLVRLDLVQRDVHDVAIGVLGQSLDEACLMYRR